MTNEKLEEIRKRDACSWASSSDDAQAIYDRSALLEEVDRMREVLREAVQEREREIMEDMGRICKLGVMRPVWYYNAKALIGGE